MLYYKLNLGLIGNKENDCFLSWLILYLRFIVFDFSILIFSQLRSDYSLTFHHSSLIVFASCIVYSLWSKLAFWLYFSRKNLTLQRESIYKSGR